MTCPEIRIRAYRDTDRDDVLRLAERLTVGIAAWLDEDRFAAVARRWVAGSIAAIGPDAAVLVADDGNDRCLGFVSAARKIHFTGEEQVYVGELVVADDAEGRGVGRTLMRAVEHWAIEQGCRSVTLETGANNQAARTFYQRIGYQEESVRLTRVLSSSCFEILACHFDRNGAPAE